MKSIWYAAHYPSAYALQPLTVICTAPPAKQDISDRQGDGKLPKCSNCKKARSRPDCTYPGATFRQSQLSILATEAASSPSLEACSVSTPYETVTNNIAAADHSPTDYPSHGVISANPPAEHSADQEVGHHASFGTTGSFETGDSPQSMWMYLSPANPQNFEGLKIWISNKSHVTGTNPTTDRAELSARALDNLHEKVKISEEERIVFEFYLQHAGVWLDIVSLDQCFAQTVPQLSIETPVLYRSCLAYGARIMYLWDLKSRASADDYHNQAIQLLIPLLGPKIPTAATDVLLAITVVLRMSEQFSEPGEDAQCHMNGAFSLFTSSRSKWGPDRVDIQGTSFWVFVRQSLRISFLSEQECRFDLNLVDDSNMLAPARDDIWTNRMTYILAKACRICWSPTMKPEELDRNLDTLETEVNEWRGALPQTFEPWYFNHAPSEPFPTMRYFSRWHARLACGVVLSEKDIGVGINGAHHAYWCGQFFTGCEEQRTLLRWLNDFMEQSKWPNKTTIKRLQELWRLDEAGTKDSSQPPII
ncbi:unnamed protein product [Clonostachys rhizophaga]|uniref:Uncharacterized protein n=1 Tax=Clonostachys rhizophaga TaxID=160324 RepID=A0A9N9YN55_9HYPO|nr:unnamed protein product [Clonostachys rhizophaga]